MPGISGLDLLKQAEMEFPGIVFIMLTNHEDFNFALESLHYRAVDYLVKNSLSLEILQKALTRAITERENRNKLHRVTEADDLLYGRQRQEQLRNVVNNFLQNDQPLSPEDTALLKEEGISSFAFAFIPVNFSVLPEYQDSPQEQRKIFDWQAEITEHLAASFFPRSLLLPQSGSLDADGELLLFAWDLRPQTWDADIARFRERLIKTSGQITRLGVDVIASDFFPSCGTSPSQTLTQIKEQYYRSGKGTYPEAVQKALQYILSHVEEKITLQDMANFACVSSGYLSTLFKREYNQNLMDFINQAKVDRACELLKDKKLRINEIAYLLGYENAFYFSRVFKRHTGLTPSEFRDG
jgi:YesN/AraC family two-component response regulator